MKTLLNIREVLAGVFDADYYPLGLGEDGQPIGEPMPYTLAPEDIESADMSNASMLSEADKQAEADQQAVNEENQWITQELSWADVEIRKHEDGHARLKGSLPALRQYRNDLRDRVVDGVIKTGSKPVRP